MVGAVRGIDPRTGFAFDDTRRYVEASSLDAASRAAVYEGNARRVYPRLDARLRAAGR
jgi:4-oxalmesaconate hydratase